MTTTDQPTAPPDDDLAAAVNAAVGDQPPTIDYPYTDDVPPVHVAFSRVMAEVKAVGKDHRMDPEAGGYMYRSVDDVYDAVQEPLSNHGVIILPHVVQRTVTIVQNERGKAQRHIEVQIICRIIGPRGDEIRFPTWGEGMDRRDRATQKAITDADKYATLRALRIRVHDADDENGDDDGDSHWTPAPRQQQAPAAGNGNGAAEHPGDDPDREHRDLIQDVTRKAANLKRAGVIDAKTMQNALVHARVGVDEAHEAIGRLDQYESKGQPEAPAEEQEQPKKPRVPKYPGDDADDNRWRRWEMAQLAAVEVDETFRRELAKMLTGGERERTADLTRADRKQRVEVAMRLHSGALAPKYDSTGALSVTDQDNNEVDPWELPGAEVVE